MSYKFSQNEPLRLILGLAAIGQLPNQNNIADEAKHPCQATPYPFDVSRSDVLKLVRARADRDAKRAWVYAAISIGVVAFSGIAGIAIAIVFGSFTAGTYYFIRLYEDNYKIAPKFSPENFNPASLTTDFNDKIRQNVVVYRNEEPFRNFGHLTGLWTLSVDIERPADTALGTANKIEKPDIEKIEKNIVSSLARANMLGESAKSLYFVQGKKIPSMIKASGPVRPREELDDRGVIWLSEEDLSHFARRYLWLRRNSVQNEFSVSYFVRLIEVGSDLNLEMASVVMPPIADQYRKIDKITPKHGSQLLSDMVYSFFGGVVMLIGGPIIAFLHVQELLSFTNPHKRIIKQVERTPGYDFGAPDNLRRLTSDFSAMSYFHIIDQRHAEAAFTGRITRAFIDALDECNIDTSELREQRSTLLNQGIIVQGGDLRAENVAAGTGAKAGGLVGTVSGKVGVQKGVA